MPQDLRPGDQVQVLAAYTEGARRGRAAVVVAGTRWLDRDALSRLAAAGDEDGERRLRQLGLDHVGSDGDPPATLVDLTRSALAESAPDPPTVAEPPPSAGGDTPHTLLAVWGPKGAPGRTTVAVNLAFEAAPMVGEVLLVDADIYGGAVAHTNIQ